MFRGSKDLCQLVATLNDDDLKYEEKEFSDALQEVTIHISSYINGEDEEDGYDVIHSRKSTINETISPLHLLLDIMTTLFTII